ncbi:hypothetical protein PFMC_01920 [Plasmodium falciparum CAMP/Malaysia]|uniref:Guanylate cyclase domain-containing protein n=2 Tax=Plasmodium falciparum TaxID=5833 RepID=A0A024XAK3_PLAFC|nr:hypothetical protein PFMC_01920 [Plasmodium falciparum CAMP/Malaysia]
MLKNIFSEYLKSYDNKDENYERINNLSRNYSCDYTSDWRWFSIKCERFLENELYKKYNKEEREKKKKNKNIIKENENLAIFRSFFPKILLNIYSKCENPAQFFSNLVIQKFNSVVFFCDASGFSNLAEQLDKRINGTELLGNCLNKFFNILIKIIDYWGGDIIKFSGDAVLVIWPLHNIIKHHMIVYDNIKNYNLKNNKISKSNIAQANNSDDNYPSDYNKKKKNQNAVEIRKICLLALGCCMDIHKLLNKFPTPIENKYLKVHIAITYGKVSFLQIGNVLRKREYLLSGKPLEEIGAGESLAKNGESVLSYSFYKNIKDKVMVQGTCKKNFFLFVKMKEEIDMKNVVKEEENISKNNIKDNKRRNSLEDKIKKRFTLLSTDKQSRQSTIIYENFDLLLKTFIPDIVYRKLSLGCNIFFNEIRKVTIIFVSVKDIDASTMTGVHSAHGIMKLTQKAVFTMEGTINKFILDDKGILILIMFGLPPLYHCDDTIRALLTCFRLIDALKSLKLNGSIGISTGKIWCGIIGNKIRKEYTALGDSVNVAARLCFKAGNKEIYVDENTYNNCKHFISFQKLISIKVKGKNKLIKIYSPIGTINKKSIDYVYDNTSNDNNYFTDEELLVNNQNNKKNNNILLNKEETIKNVHENLYTNIDLSIIQNKLIKTNYQQIFDFSFLNNNFLFIYYKSFFKNKIYHLYDDFHGKSHSPSKSFSSINNTYNNLLTYDMIYSLSRFNKIKTSLHVDYKSYTGPFLLHEYYDPFHFKFKELSRIGGVLFVEGNENLGIFEFIKLITNGLYNFKLFNVSNMPNSLYINITNPLLPWKILCNDILNTWKLSHMRKKNLLLNKNDNFNMLREITHPSYHWFFKSMIHEKEYYNHKHKNYSYQTNKYIHNHTNKKNEHNLIQNKINTNTQTQNASNNSNNNIFCQKISTFLEYFFHNSRREKKKNKKKSKEKIKKKKKTLQDGKHIGNTNDMDAIYNGPSDVSHGSTWDKQCNNDDDDDDIHDDNHDDNHDDDDIHDDNHDGDDIHDDNHDGDDIHDDFHDDDDIHDDIHHDDNIHDDDHHDDDNYNTPVRKHNVKKNKLTNKHEPSYPKHTATGDVSSSSHAYSRNDIQTKMKNELKENRIGIISSMIYYFTLHENMFIIFNYRSGTSLNINIEDDAWKISNNIAKLAMLKRKKISKHLQKNLKDWRKNHSRKCDFCKGNFMNTTYVNNVHENNKCADNIYGNITNLNNIYGDNTNDSFLHNNDDDDNMYNSDKQNRLSFKKNINDFLDDHMRAQSIDHKSSSATLINNSEINSQIYNNENIIHNTNKQENINVLQLFKEEKDIVNNTNKIKEQKMFYKTLCPNIKDNILLYIAQQKMNEQNNNYQMNKNQNSKNNYLNDNIQNQINHLVKDNMDKHIYNNNNNNNNDNVYQNKSPLCNPFFMHKHKPLIFLFINGMKNNSNIKQLKKIKKYAQQCEASIELKPFNKYDLYEFVSLCLNIHKDKISTQLIEYLNKTCFGIPKFYIFLYLVMEEMQLPFKKSYDETKETDINVSLTKNNENQIGYEETEKQLNTGVSNLSDVSQIKSEIYDNILNMYNNETKSSEHNHKSKSKIEDNYFNDQQNEHTPILHQHSLENQKKDEEDYILDEEIINETLENEYPYDENIYQQEKTKYTSQYEYYKIHDDKIEKDKNENALNQNNRNQYKIIKKNKIKLSTTSDEVKNYSTNHITHEDIILDIYKNTLEHKKTNFLCLEEILKNINLILKKQIDLNHSNEIEKSERKILLKNIYQIKKHIEDKSFNSLNNKDFIKYFIKNFPKEETRVSELKLNEETKKDTIKFNISYNLNGNKKNDHTYIKRNNEQFIETNKNFHLFLSHLNQLEKSILTFTHFCTNISNQTHTENNIYLNTFENKTAYCMSLIDSLNQEEQLLAKLCSFFNNTFNIKKMECIYPKYISRCELKKIIVKLVEKNVFCLYEDPNKKSVTLPKDNVNSIHNINFVYRDMYNKINSFLEKKSKHHSLFGKHKNVPDEEIYFCITNFSLKKVITIKRKKRNNGK